MPRLSVIYRCIGFTAALACVGMLALNAYSVRGQVSLPSLAAECVVKFVKLSPDTSTKQHFLEATEIGEAAAGDPLHVVAACKNIGPDLNASDIVLNIHNHALWGRAGVPPVSNAETYTNGDFVPFLFATQAPLSTALGGTLLEDGSTAFPLTVHLQYKKEAYSPAASTMLRIPNPDSAPIITQTSPSIEEETPEPVTAWEPYYLLNAQALIPDATSWKTVATKEDIAVDSAEPASSWQTWFSPSAWIEWLYED